ncbi:MAG TPA: glycosyltransferase [Phycisphaerales bacterium]|nr:glycosyltransferase [Phycisphaerales bacterium]
MTHTRLLILLNPGRVSRQYLLGIESASRRSGIPTFTLELGPVWSATRLADAPARAAAAEWFKRAHALCKRERITHVLSYVFNGVTSFGLAADQQGARCSPFTLAGARHILLWTDHPNWAADRSAFNPAMRSVLAHPLHDHVLKSRSAAEEAGAILDWPSTRAMPMGEDPAQFQPATGIQPIHDAVAILSDASEVPAPLTRFLGDSDPDPADLASEMIPEAMARFSAALDRAGVAPAQRTVCNSLAHDWLAAHIAHPLQSFWRLSSQLGARHATTLDFLAADPARWYDAVAALQSITRWRRNFWLAWLGRRVNLGVYGCSSAPLGLSQPAGAEKPIAYNDQSRIYALGRAAININAGHDEEGLTHKPFQIAAGGAGVGGACIHHDSLGLSDSFEPGEEIITFDRGPELLDAVRALSSDDSLRRRIAEAMHARFRADHTWQHRLPALLNRQATPPRAAVAPVHEPVPIAA